MRPIVQKIFLKAVEAMMPNQLIKNVVRLDGSLLTIEERVFDLAGFANIIVVGAGKAASGMALALEELLGAYLNKGFIVTKYGHSVPLKQIEQLEAGHPVPDPNSIEAARRILEIVSDAGSESLLIFLMSGGASSLLTDLPPNTSLSELQETYDLLLRSGASISEMNRIRKLLSPGIKGGGLARAAQPATMISLIISDVPGDEMSDIGSGPTIPQAADATFALSTIGRYPLLEKLPENCLHFLKTRKSFPIKNENNYSFIIGNNSRAMQIAVAAAKNQTPIVIQRDKPLQGEAREVALQLLKEIELLDSGEPFFYIAGGETTVTIRGNGKGGRNQELALAACIAMQHSVLKDRLCLLSAGTDGTDGPTDATGAWCDASILAKAKERSLSPEIFLHNNDAYTFFEITDGLLKTGPTGTNVMDLLIAYVSPVKKTTKEGGN